MKETNIEKVIAALEAEKRVIDMAIAALRRQMPPRKPRAVAKAPDAKSA